MSDSSQAPKTRPRSLLRLFGALERLLARRPGGGALTVAPRLLPGRLELEVAARQAASFSRTFVIEPRSARNLKRSPASTRLFSISYIGEDPVGAAAGVVDAVLSAIGALLKAHERGMTSKAAAESFPKGGPAQPAIARILTTETLKSRQAEVGSGTGREHTLRISFACNQDCGFCFVALSKRTLPLEQIERELSSIEPRARAEERLVISGGEPASHPRLPEIVSLARRMGFREILLQTNAVYHAKRELAGRLGPLTYLISFHSHLPGVYDRCTRSTGQFPLAVRGIQNVLRIAGNQVALNVVINRLNFGALPAYVRFVSEMSQGRPISINFNMLNDVGLSRAPELGIDLRRIRPNLNKALALCRRLGVGVSSFSGDCSLPVCQFLEHAAHASGCHYAQDDVRYGDAIEDGRGRAKATECKECVYDQRCRGVPMAYARLFGLSALEPVRPSAAASATGRISSAP